VNLIRVALACIFLTGCVSVSNVKTLSIPASQSDVAVTGRAQANCYDLILFLTCKLYLALESSSGQVDSDFPARGTASVRSNPRKLRK